MNNFLYPPAVYGELKPLWSKKYEVWDDPTPLPSQDIVENIIGTVYHASFLTDEGRRFWYRIVFIREKDLGEETIFSQNDYNPVRFKEPRLFKPKELVKLSPAINSTQGLIAVELNEKTLQLEIWGVIFTGTYWWKNTQKEEGKGGRLPPNAFTVTSLMPGHILITRRGIVIYRFEQGDSSGGDYSSIYSNKELDILERGFDEFVNDINIKIAKKGLQSVDKKRAKRYYNNFFPRLLHKIRALSHGGVVIVLPDEIDPDSEELKSILKIKYQCTNAYAWNTLVAYSVINQICDDEENKIRNKSERNKEICKDYIGDIFENNILEESTNDIVDVFASLSSVDGAIVITNKLRLLGFGAEMIVSSSHLQDIHLFDCSKGNQEEIQNIDHFGTRHRSAFRFCSICNHAIVFTISQDGQIKVSKKVGKEVYAWNNIEIGPFSI